MGRRGADRREGNEEGPVPILRAVFSSTLCVSEWDV